jgi:hypothetical protein
MMSRQCPRPTASESATRLRWLNTPVIITIREIATSLNPRRRVRTNPHACTLPRPCELFDISHAIGLVEVRFAPVVLNHFGE